jgi:hypothetical protein
LGFGALVAATAFRCVTAGDASSKRQFKEIAMKIRNLVGAATLVLVCLPVGVFAADGPDVSRQPTVTAGDAGRPSMARGTDLRPCKPGTHSEFSRMTGGYRCMPNI